MKLYTNLSSYTHLSILLAICSIHSTSDDTFIIQGAQNEEEQQVSRSLAEVASTNTGINNLADRQAHRQREETKKKRDATRRNTTQLNSTAIT